MNKSRLLVAVRACVLFLGLPPRTHAAMFDINTSSSPTVTGFTVLNGTNNSTVTPES